MIGGYNVNLGEELSSVEIINLNDDDNSESCDRLPFYPGGDGGMTCGALGGAAVVKCCGNWDDLDECFDLDPIFGVWTPADSMLESRHAPRSSFLQGLPVRLYCQSTMIRLLCLQMMLIGIYLAAAENTAENALVDAKDAQTMYCCTVPFLVVVAVV